MFKALAPVTLLTAIAILPLAFILDLAGLILAITGAGEVFSYITDVIGLVFIGGWTFVLSGTAKVTYGAEKRLTKLAKGARLVKWMRWLRPLLIIFEFIPFVGAAPSWTILILLELKYSMAQAQ